MSIMGNDKPLTTMAEMQKVQDSLKSITYRAEVLEKKLKTVHMSEVLREALEKELEMVKKSIAEKNEQMRNLRKENTKSFMVAVMLMFVTFLVFGLYKMFVESKVK